VRGGSHPGQVGRTSYDLALAHELYKQLLGPVEAHLKDKRHWIVVPDGALTGLPFQVLVTATPEAARDEATAYQQAAWLIRDHALMVLPAVANLRLRELRKDKKSASEPFTGFGDPVIGSTGPIACPEPLAPVPVAMDPSKMPAGKVLVRSAAGVESDSLFRSGATAEGVLVADVERVRALPRLPDTRCELEGLARQLGAPRTTVHVAEAATETAVKELSESGELARYRLVAFATHGLTANEGEGMRKGQGTELKPLLVAAGSAPADAEEVKAEPALVLTPPKQGTIADDGLLTASEVVALKLNAEWVLLSACNTAGEAEPGAESLSGLAKAFFYAGADSLLVSNWPVYSDAAVQLTTGAIKALVAEPGIGRAEALRRSMLAFLDPQRPSGDAHPSRWGPFTLVGEGQPQSGKGK
jgi:CHAT domain-containing protein